MGRDDDDEDTDEAAMGALEEETPKSRREQLDAFDTSSYKMLGAVCLTVCALAILVESAQKYGPKSTTVLRLIQKLRFSEKRPTGKGLPPPKKLVDSVFKRNLAMVQAMQFLPGDKRRQKVEISRVVWLMKLLGAKSFPFARC